MTNYSKDLKIAEKSLEKIKTEIGLIIAKYIIHFKEPQNFSKIFGICMGNQELKTYFSKNIKVAQELCKEVTEKVNKLSIEELQKQFPTCCEEKPKEKREKKLEYPKMELGKEVVTAYPPDPSKYPHIGHGYASFINYNFAKMHNGKFILRFEDTNPAIVKKEYYDAILNGLKWLGVIPDKIVNASDYIEKLYGETRKFIKASNVYICDCYADVVKSNRQARKECKCRKKTVEQNLEEFENLVKGKYEPGKKLVRLKLNMKSKRAEIRDPGIMRTVLDEHPLVGTKYKLWPSYVWQNTFLDNYNGVTHRFRSKEFEPWKPVQEEIAKMAGFKMAQIYEYARVNISGVKASGRQIRELVEKGEMEWDDPRLTTLLSLKRRGFIPNAIIEFIQKMGLSKTESTAQWGVLESFNRKELANVEKVAFFTNTKEFIVNKEKIYINPTDLKEGTEYRLRHFCNVIYKKDKLDVCGNEIKKGISILPFAKEIKEVTVVMDNAKEVKGFIEVKPLKETNYFFEGLGFVKIDSLKPLVAYFTHK